MTDEDWQQHAEEIRKSAERQEMLEAIAACLRDEGLAALPQRRPGETATTYILVLICRTRYLLGHSHGNLTITVVENRLAQIPLADPEVFKKAKEVIERHYATLTSDSR